MFVLGVAFEAVHEHVPAALPCLRRDPGCGRGHHRVAVDVSGYRVLESPSRVRGVSDQRPPRILILEGNTQQIHLY